MFGKASSRVLVLNVNESRRCVVRRGVKARIIQTSAKLLSKASPMVLVLKVIASQRDVRVKVLTTKSISLITIQSFVSFPVVATPKGLQGLPLACCVCGVLFWQRTQVPPWQYQCPN